LATKSICLPRFGSLELRADERFFMAGRSMREKDASCHGGEARRCAGRDRDSTACENNRLGEFGMEKVKVKQENAKEPKKVAMFLLPFHF